MSLRRSVIGVASSLVGLLRTRLELFGLEAAEEKSRLVKLLAMAFGALLFLTLAVLVVTIAIAVAVWPTEQRYMALGCLAGVYALIGVGLLMTVRRLLVHDPSPFAATLDALQQDVAMLERVRVDDDDYDAPGHDRAQER
ncbi:membrane protein [Bordetella ansorpii]|uniref:Membrane protein n=1 Tax=Bordetella ansorpii TaxID=288768 RepID=A0A157LLG6_9BORD|nr:phage holin family protein [Bordetella ansorpii]SAH97588.1 membrane protein [Bordetella ansorpii]